MQRSKRNGNGYNSGAILIPSAWIAIVFQMLAMIFIAGAGWNRLGNAETQIDRLGEKLEEYSRHSSGLNERLIRMETTLTVISNRLEKIETQLKPRQ